MKSARLASCNIDSVDASLADFTDSEDLTAEQIDSCFGCAGTKLPPELEPHRPKHWHPTKLTDWDERKRAYQAWLETR